MSRGYVSKALAMAARLRREHGLVRALGLLALQALARVTNATVLVCMHKPVGRVKAAAGRLLSRAEIVRASQDSRLDLPPEFVAATRRSQCYGVLVDDRVRSYAWTSSEAVWAVPQAIVKMSSEATYVYKAFTHESFRRRGLLVECLKAIEQGAAREGRDELTALVDVDNQGSLRAFRNAGFDRCGFVVILRRPWLLRRIGCRSTSPCAWCKESESASD